MVVMISVDTQEHSQCLDTLLDKKMLDHTIS